MSSVIDKVPRLIIVCDPTAAEASVPVPVIFIDSPFTRFPIDNLDDSAFLEPS